jgi:hypothetical protein
MCDQAVFSLTLTQTQVVFLTGMLWHFLQIHNLTSYCVILFIVNESIYLK